MSKSVHLFCTSCNSNVPITTHSTEFKYCMGCGNSNAKEITAKKTMVKCRGCDEFFTTANSNNICPTCTYITKCIGYSRNSKYRRKTN